MIERCCPPDSEGLSAGDAYGAGISERSAAGDCRYATGKNCDRSIAGIREVGRPDGKGRGAVHLHAAVVVNVARNGMSADPVAGLDDHLPGEVVDKAAAREIDVGGMRPATHCKHDVAGIGDHAGDIELGISGRPPSIGIVIDADKAAIRYCARNRRREIAVVRYLNGARVDQIDANIGGVQRGETGQGGRISAAGSPACTCAPHGAHGDGEARGQRAVQFY